MNWDKGNARVNWAYQRLIFDITLYNQFISEQTGKMSEDKIAEVRFLRALNYYYFLDLLSQGSFQGYLRQQSPYREKRQRSL